MEVGKLVSNSVLLVAVVVVIINIFFSGGLVRADFFSAISELENVLQMENEVAHDLRSYVKSEEARLQNLKKIADDFEKHSLEALVDPEKHLSNPINAYLLVKRFTKEWNELLEQQIKSTSLSEFLKSLSTKTSRFPTEDDLQGAAYALMRLQDTYALPSSKLVKGDLQGIQDSVHMTAQDCFMLGSIAYKGNDFYHTIIWMSEALRMSKDDPSIDNSTLLDYLAYSYYMQGNTKKALNLTKEWLLIDPNHIRAQNNLRFYEQLILEQESRARSRGEQQTHYDENSNPRPMDAYKLSSDFQNYEKLCRGEKTQALYNEHLLTCQYRRHHPFLYINPIKEEQVNWEPRMFLFHDVMTDGQIARIKKIGKPKLGRSVVYHKSNSQVTTPQDYRISKSGWLKDEDDRAVYKFSYMAGLLSNLTLDTVEDLQVLNYGIGGHYEPHYDFATSRELDTFEKAIGNRIATFICYLSDVQAGGATVFPGIGVSFWPRKAKCAFWYNLMRSGEGDMRTRHAACPVLSGIKWACNKWFHERGQEFIRPCTLSPLE
ncbi:hypothetical protein HELRODRAFT_93833 [Helobdella robusta]|uniref:procollagen-proline 4-dioxygenase n=1 Tax=Helobdella robusta TaxID=6412 RepID=T1G8X8_HELRO|nr:hypothetical protein HELRODRAFT_93833 [Helobdella robusta]ESO05885.1 hypothetical protein HELRODRAFT_93833 [Helobdella robusta]